jgi:hypothetical protein
MNRQDRRAYGSNKKRRSITGMPKKPGDFKNDQRYSEVNLPPRGTPGDVEDVHAGRYPKHDDPHKGQVFGGTCNTTLCDKERAVFFNAGTYGLYCVTCARGQNGNDSNQICTQVPAKPSLDGMQEMHSLFMVRMRT